MARVRACSGNFRVAPYARSSTASSTTVSPTPHSIATTASAPWATLTNVSKSNLVIVRGSPEWVSVCVGWPKFSGASISSRLTFALSAMSGNITRITDRAPRPNNLQYVVDLQIVQALDQPDKRRHTDDQQNSDQ